MELRDFLDELNYYFKGNQRAEESAKELFAHIYEHPLLDKPNPTDIPLSTYRKYLFGDSMRIFCQRLLPGLSKGKFSKYLDSFGDSPKEDLIESLSDEYNIEVTMDNFGEQLAVIFIEAIKEEAKTGEKRTHKKTHQKREFTRSDQTSDDCNTTNPDSDREGKPITQQILKTDKVIQQQANKIYNIEYLETFNA